MNPAVVAAEICPGEPLDVGIAPVVKVLRDNGVETFESCEGGEGHAFADPTVRFHGSPAAGWQALAVCLDFRLPARTLSRHWDLNAGEPCGPYWALVFGPAVRNLPTEVSA